MIRYFQKKFFLSPQGAKDLIKGSLLSALVNLTMMIPVGLFILLLNELLKPLLEPGIHTQPSVVKYSVFILIAVFILYISHYYQYSSVYISIYRESATRRTTLAEKLRQLPLAFFGQRNLSDLTNTIMTDCTSLEHAFSHAIPQLLGAILSTTVVIISLLCMDFRMGLALLWVIPVAFVMILGSKHIQNKSELKHYKAKRICADGIQECLETIQDIKAYNMKESYINELDRKLDASEQAQIKSELTMGACVTSAQAVLRLGLATTILVGANLFIQGETNLLTYLIFLITASRLYDPLSGTLSNIAEIFSVQIPTKRMQEIETQPIQEGKKEYKTDGYDIQFSNVAFSYNENEPVLKDVSFVAKQGEVTALIGPSGSGKSTAAKLASRFWDVNAGKVTLGGQDITTIDPEMMLKNYSIVFQDVTLFNDTIMENIRLGRKTATEEEVIFAAKVAMCHTFVMNMPNGYETIIGENGSTLSGGERQRISIARALLKNSPIVLLDEATASLDVENETEIQKAISELVKNKTVLVIAHRMRTIANADKIVVLDDGYVSQQGNPQQLLDEGGLYQRMIELQSQSLNWSL